MNPHEPDEPTRKILIIDDDPSVLESMSFFLEDCGFQVFRESDGAAGIGRFMEYPTDCVLTDLRMPAMSGLQVIEAVASTSPETPIIVISGADDILGVTESFRLGAWDYLTKPLKDLSILKHRVDNVLEKARLLRENRRYQESLEEMVRERTAELWDIRVGLEEKVASRTQELEKALRRIARDERVRSLSRMVAGVAHELNTPLGIAVSAVTNIETLLQADFPGDDPNACEDRLTRVGESIRLATGNLKKMSGLIRRFRGIAASGEGERRQDVNIGDLLQMLIRGMHSQLEEAGLRVELQCPEDLVFPSSPLSLLTVFDELITNCMIHSFGDGESGTLDIRVSRSDRHVIIELADNGVGMEPETAARIFEPFFTGSRSHDRSGLGLSVIWNIVVDQLDGTMECDTSPGKGTRFTLRLSAG